MGLGQCCLLSRALDINGLFLSKMSCGRVPCDPNGDRHVKEVVVPLMLYLDVGTALAK
jgi:hypothetical protein